MNYRQPQNLFEQWSIAKQKLHTYSENEIYFKEGDIWMFSCGVNIGFEQNGKGSSFLRPILIIKKFNSSLFWGIPLSTTKKRGKYYFSFEFIGGVESVALLSQLRLFDAKRLQNKMGGVSKNLLQEIIEKIKALF